MHPSHAPKKSRTGARALVLAAILGAPTIASAEPTAPPPSRPDAGQVDGARPDASRTPEVVDEETRRYCEARCRMRAGCSTDDRCRVYRQRAE